jgi:TIR domain-containing protein/sulfatase-modifying factor enzyme 1
MARIFVSYSRKNKDFCRQLTNELEKRDLDFWVDWDGIPPTVDWMKEIEKGIEEADTFLAVVSPDWISSRVCIDELNMAVKNGKRLIPVVPCDIVWESVPPALAQLNFIFFTEAFDHNEQLNKLFAALDTDYDWLKTHRRLQVKALDWERSNKESGFLLHGRDLEDAEQQISINANKEPHPTDIQREYVLKSRQGSTRQRRITTGILIGLIAGMLGVIALLARPYVEEAIARAQARELSGMMIIPAGSIEFYLVDGSQTINLAEFHIGLQPVTNRAYGLCVKVDKCTPPIGSTEFTSPEKQDEPVVWLTVVQAATYCKWIGHRLPSAPEWEHAVAYFADSNINRFLLSTHYEWTSSYVTEDSPSTIGKWDEDISNLNLKSYFLEEKGSINSSGDAEIFTNPDGAFGANGKLSFRCARN